MNAKLGNCFKCLKSEEKFSASFVKANICSTLIPLQLRFNEYQTRQGSVLSPVYDVL